MAVDMILDVATLTGESVVDGFAGKIDILAWSWGVSNAGSAHIGGGIGAGKANFQDISITKYVDLVSAKLLKSVAVGTHFPTAKIIVRKSGGDAKLPYLQIEMKDVMATSYQTGGSGGEDRLTESLTLTFAEVKLEYKKQGKDGKESGGDNFAYKISEGKAA